MALAVGAGRSLDLELGKLARWEQALRGCQLPAIHSEVARRIILTHDR